MMHTPNLADDRGIALAISVFAMVVIGGLVGATFYVGHLEQRSGRNTMYAIQSFEASEAGLTSVLTTWNGSYNSLAVGNTMTLPTVNLSGMVSFTPALTRLNSNLFLVKCRREHHGRADRWLPDAIVDSQCQHERRAYG